MPKITPFLWYNGQIREAADFYKAVFPSMQIVGSTPGPDGTLMSATLEIEGQQFIIFNGGAHYALTPAVSLYVNCETQQEVDRLWSALLADGGRESQCGWLLDRFGLSWQVIPTALPRLLGDPDRAKAGRAMQAMLKMSKIDVATLERAAAAA